MSIYLPRMIFKSFQIIILSTGNSAVKYQCNCNVERHNPCQGIPKTASCNAEFCLQTTACSNHSNSICFEIPERNGVDGYECRCPSSSQLTEDGNCRGTKRLLQFPALLTQLVKIWTETTFWLKIDANSNENQQKNCLMPEKCTSFERTATKTVFFWLDLWIFLCGWWRTQSESCWYNFTDGHVYYKQGRRNSEKTGGKSERAGSVKELMAVETYIK